MPFLVHAAPPTVSYVTFVAFNLSTDMVPSRCYGESMSRRSIIVLAALLALPFLTFAQQPDNDAVKAVQILEKYREQQIPLWMSDFGNLGRYREANAKLVAPKDGETRVVFLGDSITDGWHLEQSFPSKPYINRGISGQTTPQMLIRFRPDVIDLAPKAVVILAGTNDIAGNTGPMTPAEIEANYASISDLARAHNIRVVFSSVLPVSNYSERSKVFFPLRSPAEILDLNRWMKDYCARTGCIYLDYFSAMVDDRGLMRADLAEDGLHPNPKGYAIMAPLAQKAIEQALAAH